MDGRKTLVEMVFKNIGLFPFETMPLLTKEAQSDSEVVKYCAQGTVIFLPGIKQLGKCELNHPKTRQKS